MEQVPEAPSVASAAAPVVNGAKNTGDPAVVFIDMGGASCSGTLVSKEVVLTARHCVLDIGQGAHKVGFGHGWDGTFNMVGTKGYAYFPGDNRDLSTDIAVIFLSEPAPDGIAPLPVNAADLATHVSEPVRIVGFGITNSGENDSGVKRVGMSVLDRVTATLSFHHLSPAASCSGDSGGPQFMTINGVEFVAGVTSFGSSAGCDVGEHGAVRTDAFLDWLSQHFDTQFDKVAPTVTITSPGGPSVSPGFTVTADAADDRGLSRVVLKIDGNVVATDKFAPYEFTPPANLPAGAHELEVVAFDDYENAGSAKLAVDLAPSCATNDDCGDGFDCTNGICVAAIGTECSSPGDCASGECYHPPGRNEDSFCTRNCASDSECPSGFACEGIELSPVTKCMPSDSGGCEAAPGGRAQRLPAAAALLAFVLIGVARRRRRSS